MENVSAWAVCASFALMVLSNYLATKKYFGKDNKEISDSHPTYVSPDGFTFAIWGLIYLFELILVLAQLVGWSPDAKDSADMIFDRQCPLTGLDVRQRLVIAFLANAAWLPVFNTERFSAALGIMAVYFACLLSINLDLNAATVGFPMGRFIFGAGVAMNASWILVAFSLSIFFCAGEFGWKDRHGVAGTASAGTVVVMFVSFIGCARAVLECEMAWSFVAAWALRGIYRMQTVENVERFPSSAMSPTLASFALWASRAIDLSMLVGVAWAAMADQSASVHFEGASARLLPHRE